MAEVQEYRTILSSPTTEISVNQVGLKSGLITGASLIIYFMIMKYFIFMDSAIAWSFNFIILFTGIILAYRDYRSKTKPNIDYLPGLILGGITTAVSVVLFVMFVYIYFSSADGVLMESLKNNILFMGEQITPLRAAGATMVEGLCSGVIISFIMMQYYRSGFRRARNESIHG